MLTMGELINFIRILLIIALKIPIIILNSINNFIQKGLYLISVQFINNDNFII